MQMAALQAGIWQDAEDDTVIMRANQTTSSTRVEQDYNPQVEALIYSLNSDNAINDLLQYSDTR